MSELCQVAAVEDAGSMATFARNSLREVCETKEKLWLQAQSNFAKSNRTATVGCDTGTDHKGI